MLAICRAATYKDTALINKGSSINGLLSLSRRLYHTSEDGNDNKTVTGKNEKPNRNKKKSWNLPDNGFDEEPKVGRRKVPKIIDKTGMFTNDGPNVPPNWRKNKNLEGWRRQMFALREKFHDTDGWRPTKKLSRDAMEGIRAIKAENPELSSGDIAEHFKISSEAVRRILKSKWKPSEKESGQISARWKRRGERLKGIAAEQEKEATASTNEEKTTVPSSSKKKKKKGRRTDIGDMYF